MASNILFLPFRKSHSLALSEPIKQYISSKYDQHPDMFKLDLEVVDNLRRDAINVKEPHTSGLKKLAAYAAQLVWIGGKFPIDIGADFTWFPALGYNTERPISQNNLKYELSNILFNLAALYSQLAISVNRSTADGLKAACNYFSLAAGVLSHIRTNIVPELRAEPVEDMDVATLESLQQLFLAQAQECFWQKAVIDGYKDASIAKLAARVSDLYSSAGDWAVKSEAVSSEWIHHMTAKHHHFAAAAQYRQACDCLEKRKYGEEVARLRDSMLCVNEALKEARYINKTVLGDLNGLKNKVLEDLKRAEKDNDVIYLNPVPPKSELKTLDRANMAIARVPKDVAEPYEFLGDGKEFGRPLFQQLVPFAVHIAASIYEERRDRIANTNIVEEIEVLNAKIHETLRSLGLPGSLQALEKPLGLPAGLLSHAEEIRQADAINRLQRSFSDTAKLKSADELAFIEGRETLQAEAAEDERLRMKYGTDRWTRPDSKSAAGKLYAQIIEIDGYLRSASNSDDLVKSKYRECEDMLRVLSSSDRDIGNFVPSSRRVTIAPKLEAEAIRLRTCLNDLTRLESRRRRKIELVREKAKKDDIKSTILVEAARLERLYPNSQIVPAHFEDFFEERLSKYDPDIESLKEEAREQDVLLVQLQNANAEFIRARRSDSVSKEREQVLQALENAYFQYKEVVNNLEVGRKFYNDLSKIANRFRDDCKAFSYRRRSEAAQLENDLSLPAISSLSLKQQLPDEPRILRSAGARHEPRMSESSYSSDSRSNISQRNEPQIPAPIPQTPPVQAGMWSPGMGIKFGDVPGAGASLGAKGQGQDSNGGLKPGQWDPSAGVRFG